MNITVSPNMSITAFVALKQHVGDIILGGTVNVKGRLINIEVVVINVKLGVLSLLIPALKEGSYSYTIFNKATRKRIDSGVIIVRGGDEFSGDMDDIDNGATYVKTHNDYTDAEKSKLAGLTAGALGEEFETVSKNLKSYPCAIIYDGNDLDYITYDLGGGESIIKTFNYTDEKLTSIVLSGDTPEGIDLTKTFGYTVDDLTNITYS